MNSILITGGAGFIGINAANHFYNIGWRVNILDNLSRHGSERNLEWIKKNSRQINFFKIDIRDKVSLEEIFKNNKFDLILHLAAQVAVTKSCENPREDFEINALGTFNILEAMRIYMPKAFLINASTNKVYGGLESVKTELGNKGYLFKELKNGIAENHPLDLHSPYGCSKGTADQYAIDYSRIFSLNTTTFRQSCIYGMHQFGIEDQGWVAWFSIAALLNKQITFFGDGWQTRDILDVRDLCKAYELAWINRENISGQAFNIGGGKTNSICLRELIDKIEENLNKKIDPITKETRPGDQPVYISDIQKAKRILSWEPQINIERGLSDLINWIKENKILFKEI